MKRKLILAVAVMLIAASCSKSEPIVFQNKKFEYQASGTDKTAVINIQYPVATGGNSEAVAAANAAIEQCGAFNVLCSEQTASANLKQAQDALKSEANEFARDSINYENQCTWSGVMNQSVISLLFSEYAYTGGAHGSMMLTPLLLDAKTGTKISLMDKVTDSTKLLKLFIDEYVKQNKLLMDADPLEHSYLFIKSFKDLPMPSVFYLTEQGLVGAYGQYEVAAYVVGITTATIPYDKLTEILKLDTKELKPIEVSTK